VYVNNGSKKVSGNVLVYAQQMVAAGAGELLLHFIDRDGTYKGYDILLIQQISHAIEVPVIACGGAADVADFSKAINAGASAVAAGSMFVFQRPHQAVLISYPQL
jgi:cyclase